MEGCKILKEECREILLGAEVRCAEVRCESSVEITAHLRVHLSLSKTPLRLLEVWREPFSYQSSLPHSVACVMQLHPIDNKSRMFPWSTHKDSTTVTYSCKLWFSRILAIVEIRITSLFIKGYWWFSCYKHLKPFNFSSGSLMFFAIYSNKCNRLNHSGSCFIRKSALSNCVLEC